MEFVQASPHRGIACRGTAVAARRGTRRTLAPDPPQHRRLGRLAAPYLAIQRPVRG